MIKEVFTCAVMFFVGSVFGAIVTDEQIDAYARAFAKWPIRISVWAILGCGIALFLRGWFA